MRSGRRLAGALVLLTVAIVTVSASSMGSYKPFPAHHKHLSKYNSKLVSDQTAGWTHSIVSSQELWLVALTHGATFLATTTLVTAPRSVAPSSTRQDSVETRSLDPYLTLPHPSAATCGHAALHCNAVGVASSICMLSVCQKTMVDPALTSPRVSFPPRAGSRTSPAPPWWKPLRSLAGS